MKKQVKNLLSFVAARSGIDENLSIPPKSFHEQSLSDSQSGSFILNKIIKKIPGSFGRRLREGGDRRRYSVTVLSPTDLRYKDNEKTGRKSLELRNKYLDVFYRSFIRKNPCSVLSLTTGSPKEELNFLKLNKR